MDDPTVIARLIIVAAVIRDKFRRTSRRAKRAPPHVHKMERYDRHRPVFLLQN